MQFANDEIKLQISKTLDEKSKYSLPDLITQTSDFLKPEAKSISVIMAAGHGKRIKSSLPKVMHAVWGIPSVLRVMKAVIGGIKSPNQIVVVGKRADSVVAFLGKKKYRRFAYQHEQKGTGHALQVAVKEVPERFKGHLYVFPADMGLLDEHIVRQFCKAFEKSKLQMMMLTGVYRGHPEENYFGRIVRVPKRDYLQSLTPRENVGRVLKIMQVQDILAMKKPEVANFFYAGRRYDFTRQQLLEIDEFDSGAFAFSYPCLKKCLGLVGSKNVQKEVYLTDLVEIFNRENFSVGSFSLEESESLMGFNDKAVWRKIEDTYRRRYFQKLRNIIDIEDEARFFIAESVIADLIKRDSAGEELNIFVGSGAYISEGVFLSKSVMISSGCVLKGTIYLEEGVRLGPDVTITNLERQKVIIKKNAILEGSNTIKGDVTIGSKSFIGEGANITGSKQDPTNVGSGSIIRGSCYIFGCRLDDRTIVESSILVKKRVCRKLDAKGEVIAVRFVLPKPNGEEVLENE